ncbi:superinfection immunity protein [Pseudomonas fulva]|uniref:superinfection immunity protein n=1 Tax=Pseudomonas fulva TaxID=47880 RepID=UPI0018A9DEFF|nr:superinfection immunity protein [Pseudomonas fulva]MBF8773886.1 superinfection immunity protein [Pseudomonas fulva]
MVLESGELLSNVMKFMGIAMYLLPTIIAWSRSHHNKAPILLLNLLLGWTVLGWLAALIWSVSASKRETRNSKDSAHKTQNGEHDAYESIERLADLKERGHITAEEFEAEKSRILRR